MLGTHLTLWATNLPLADDVSTNNLNNFLKHDGVQTVVAIAAIVIFMHGVRARATAVITIASLVFVGMAVVVLSGNQTMQDKTGGFLLNLIGIH